MISGSESGTIPLKSKLQLSHCITYYMNSVMHYGNDQNIFSRTHILWKEKDILAALKCGIGWQCGYLFKES